MRQSRLLIPTMKETPADAEVASHQLMLRAGLVRQLAAGLYTWLPLGLRVVRNIERIVREEMNRAGAQEIQMPVVQPAELWEESRRWEKMGAEMLRMRDRHERDFCLGPTHEEVVTDIFRREVHSYRLLPVNLYQIQTKFRDERRPRFGVMRAREFMMKDAYSFHADQACFDTTYQAMHDAYSRTFERLQLEFRAVEADTGNIGGANSHEFHALAAAGEDVIAHSDSGPYAANLERATAAAPTEPVGTVTALTKVATPDQHTIAAVSEFLQVAPEGTVKTLVVRGDDGPVALVLRGDHELNEIKAGKLKGVAQPLTFASETEIRRATGAGPGSVGPVGLELPVFVDRDAGKLQAFVCGANEDDHHYTGANFDRDVGSFEIADLRNVVEGDRSPDGVGSLKFLRGIEIGHIFQLGTTYSEAMAAHVLDANGDNVAPIMGCYGMGITRLVAAIIEQNHDERGIAWPKPVAPFRLHVVALNYGKSDAVRTAADGLYERMAQAGVSVLLDDRDERPGVKFADADLIGVPVRVTIGERGLKSETVELQPRGGDVEEIAVADLDAKVLQACAD